MAPDQATGDMIVVRFADDTIVGFDYEHEAEAIVQDLHERLRSFELALHPDKTPLIPFGRDGGRGAILVPTATIASPSLL